MDEENILIDSFEKSAKINTREDAQVIIQKLWSMGYTAIEYLNNSANAAASVYSSSDIIVASTHGAAGKLAYNNSILYANHDETDCITDRSIYVDAGDASELDLVIYIACDSGLPSSTYGNLVDITLAKGAYACFGWNQSINSALAYFWLEYFVDVLSTGVTVQAAIDYANYSIESELGKPSREMIDEIYSGSSRLDRIIVGGY